MSVKENIECERELSSNLKLWNKLKEGFFPMVECVRWTEKKQYADLLEKMWGKLPNFVGTFLATLAIFIIGSSLKGEWMIIMIHFLKQLGYLVTGKEVEKNEDIIPFNWDNFSLERIGLKNLSEFIIPAVFGSYLIYFSVGGFIHWYFYVRRKHLAHEWKIQPNKWLSSELEIHEIMIGSLSLGISSTITGIISCYEYNDGSLLTIYHEFNEYGWIWLFLQVPVIFIYQDYMTYLLHRLYHIPFLYKRFHKLHHKYKQPTAFSVTAIHPVEIVHIQLVLLLPIVVIPVHWMMFYGIALYTYYHGLLNHSGVNFKSYWWQPWQPDSLFHDNHHQYFHVNFSFNISYWDNLHGTYRQKDRVYNENIFYGKGESLNDVPVDVLLNDIAERKSENPMAYKNNRNENELDNKDIVPIIKIKQT